MRAYIIQEKYSILKKSQRENFLHGINKNLKHGQSLQIDIKSFRAGLLLAGLTGQIICIQTPGSNQQKIRRKNPAAAFFTN